MNRTDLEKGMNEREALDADESKVADLLGALPRVEAPSNFEFGVKARIAARDTSAQASLLPFLKVAAPLTVVLLVAAFVIFYGVVPGDRNTDPVAEVAVPVETKVLPPQPTVEAPPTIHESGPQATERDRDEVVAATQPAGPIRRTTRGTSTRDKRTGGSVDQTQGVANVLTPPGFPSPGRNANAAGQELEVREILETLGVKAELVGRDWTVRSTVQNSVAARAGLQRNDVIEAIDDHNLSGEMKIKGNLTIRKCRVRRDGKQINLDFKINK